MHIWLAGFLKISVSASYGVANSVHINAKSSISSLRSAFLFGFVNTSFFSAFHPLRVLLFPSKVLSPCRSHRLRLSRQEETRTKALPSRL